MISSAWIETGKEFHNKQSITVINQGRVVRKSIKTESARTKLCTKIICVTVSKFYQEKSFLIITNIETNFEVSLYSTESLRIQFYKIAAREI